MTHKWAFKTDMRAGAPTPTLSCLLEAGHYDDLMALLALKKTSLWFNMKFGAEALLRQGCEAEALAFPEALLKDDGRQWGLPRHRSVL